MGLAAACQVYLFSIISTPKDSKVSRSLKWKAPCQLCDSYSGGLFKVVCAEVRNKAAKPPDWAVHQTLCSGRNDVSMRPQCGQTMMIIITWWQQRMAAVMLCSICGHAPHLNITLLVITAVKHALLFVSSHYNNWGYGLEDFFLPWFQLSAVSFCCLEAGVTDEKSEAHCIPLLLPVHPSLGRAWSRVPGQISLQPPLPVINQSRCRQPRPRPEDGDGGWRMLRCHIQTRKRCLRIMLKKGMNYVLCTCTQYAVPLSWYLSI